MGFLVISLAVVRELWAYYHSDADKAFPIWPLTILGGLVAYVILLRARLLKLTQQQFEKSPSAQQTNYIRADASGLRVENALSSSSFEWAAFQRAMQIDHWLLLFINESSAFYLDTRRIVPPATTTDLLQLLRLNNVKVE